MAKVADEVGATANSYQILAKLAAGGMAEIFLARGASVAGVERNCVLKRILPEHARDAQFVRMFLEEARLAAQLQHPNIASVYDIGMLGDSYFFTMEYVHGETVRWLLQRCQDLGRPVPLACVLTIIAGAAAGLHHAHERLGNDGRSLGIVHRDVSPSNVMVSYEGNVKLVDFGVAKAANRAYETQSGTVKGKIGYLSPEQCRGDRIDRRSDLFSLGVVMWELLTCTRLYRRVGDFESMHAIVHEAPPPPSRTRPDVPRAVDDLVLRLLAKPVGERYQTAAQVVEALEDVSMRAGTILSTSALSRLIGDLFGVRPEPWLALDRDLAGEPVVVSRPAPSRGHATGRAMPVVDLSDPSIEIQGDAGDADALPESIPTEPLGPAAGYTPSLAATPPRISGPVTIPDARPARSARTPMPFAAAAVHPAPHPMSTTLPWVGQPPQASPALAPFRGTATRLPTVTPSGPLATASTSIPVPVVSDLPSSPHPLPMAVHDSRPVPLPMPLHDSRRASLPAMPPLAAMPPGPLVSTRAPTQRRRAAAPPARMTWPLLTVIVVAAAVGVLIALLSAG